MQRVYFICWILFAPLLFACCISDHTEDEGEGANIGVGDALPYFKIDLSNGSSINTSDLTGKVSVIMLFSVTCSDCQRQFPVVEQVYSEYIDNTDVVIFGISRAQGEEEVSAFWNSHNYKMDYSAQDDRYVYSLFAQSIVPRIYISDRNNTVRIVYTDNPLATYTQLKSYIEGLLVEE